MNIFDFALKMEEDGKAYYEKLRKLNLVEIMGCLSKQRRRKR